MIDQDTLVRALVSERVKVLGYIQSLIRRHDLAEDIFQDVCVISMRRRESIKDEAHLRRWLRVVARRQAMNVIRKRQESHLLLDADVLELLDPAWELHDDYNTALRVDALRVCVGLLSESNRDLVSKRFVDNYEYQDLAMDLNRNIASIYVSFSRIYSILNKCIRSRLAGHGVHFG